MKTLNVQKIGRRVNSKCVTMKNFTIICFYILTFVVSRNRKLLIFHCFIKEAKEQLISIANVPDGFRLQMCWKRCPSYGMITAVITTHTAPSQESCQSNSPANPQRHYKAHEQHRIGYHDYAKFNICTTKLQKGGRRGFRRGRFHEGATESNWRRRRTKRIDCSTCSFHVEYRQRSVLQANPVKERERIQSLVRRGWS